MNGIAAAEKKLSQGLAQLSLAMDVQPLLAYLGLLQKWNHAYNLTAIKSIDDMITRHLLDSLAINPWLWGKNILDVGAGAGFPGIPLALARPDLSFVLLDSNGKKVRFMQEVKRQLSLTNIFIEQGRVETYQPKQGFDTITSRACCNIGQMLSWTKHLLAAPGQWLLMKGQYPGQELQQINYPYRVEIYQVPYLDSQRCCVVVDGT